MRLKRLRLTDVKRHRSLELELAPGLTVVRGPNEAGKTTIQRALEIALFRKPTSTAQELDGVRSWAAPDSDPRIEIDFEDEGTVGRLVKVFAGQRGTAELTVDGTTLTDPAAVDARLAEMTGLPSEKFFRSTASVRHQELDDLDRDEGALRDRLQLSMSGADRGTWVAKRKLEDAIRRYRTEGHKNPGLLKVARDAVAALQDELARGEAELARLETDRQTLAEAHDRRVALDRQLADEQAQLEASERAVAVLARLEDVQARYGRYKRAAELREQIARRESTHPSATALPALRSGIERLRGLEYTISELRAELASEPDLSDYQLAIPTPSWRAPAAVGVLAAILAVATAVAGIVASVPVLLVVAAAFAAGAVAAAIYVVRQRRIASDVRLQNDLRENEITRRLRGRSERGDQLRETERDRDGQLASLGLESLAAGEALLAAETEHVAVIDRLKAEFRGLLGDSPPEEDVSQLRDRMAAEAEEMRHALAGMGEVGASPARSRGRYLNAVRATQAQRERAVHDEAQAQARVDQNRVDAEQVAALAERLVEAQAHLAALERRVRIYELTLEAIDAAERATMKKAARYLEQRMGGDVARITDGRYRRIRVDEQQLTFSVFSPERDEWVDVRDLSQGTVDQFYLAARLGLVRQVTQHRRPPLVLDDPFVTFDDDRARRALELLKQMAGDLQVIYLTCADRYDSVADRVVTLPGPDARDHGAAADDEPDAAGPAGAGVGRVVQDGGPDADRTASDGSPEGGDPRAVTR